MITTNKHCFFIRSCLLIVFLFTGYVQAVVNHAKQTQASTDILVSDKNGFSALDYAMLHDNNDLKQLLLNSMVVMTVPQEQFAADISLGIVDLKFDGQTIKICELGEGPRSMFKGFDRLYQQGLVWRMLWHFLSCLQLTPWLMVNAFTQEMRLENALKEYEALGGGYARDVQSLAQDESFIRCLEQAHAGDYFTDYNAMMIIRNNGYHDSSLRIFKKKHPKTLVLCEALGPAGNSKLLMNSLFEGDEALQQYRPKCMVLEKRYYRTLVKKVTDVLQSECFVIKPINSSKGNGVIVVKKRDLFRMLRNVLKNPGNLPDGNDPTYGYWLHDRNKTFLIEEYAPSKLISVHGKKYDATMRVIYILFCDKGKIGLTFLGSYWKLPEKSIEDPGLLTEKHKSSIKPEHIGSALVDAHDYEKVKGLLKKVLPLAYVKMLQDREDYYKKWQNL